MTKKRFENIYTQGKLDVIKVIRDNETGILYISNHTGSGLGLTALVDQNGNPLLDNGF